MAPNHKYYHFSFLRQLLFSIDFLTITSSNLCLFDLVKVALVDDDVMKLKHFLRYWPFVWENSPVTGEFPSQRPVMRSFDVSFDLRLNKRLSKQS